MKFFLIATLSTFLMSLQIQAQKQIHRFELGDSAFLLDCKPLQLIAGEMHYISMEQ